MLDVSQISVGIGLGVGIGALGACIGLGLVGNSGLSAMARQPEASNKIQTAMLIALAFVELVFLLTFILFLGIRDKLPNYEESRKEGKLAFTQNQIADHQSGLLVKNITSNKRKI